MRRSCVDVLTTPNWDAIWHLASSTTHVRKHSDDSSPQTIRCPNWCHAEQNKLSLSMSAQTAYPWAKVIKCVGTQKIIKRANFSNSLLTIQYKIAILFTFLSHFRFLHSTLATWYICLCYYLLLTPKNFYYEPKWDSRLDLPSPP